MLTRPPRVTRTMGWFAVAVGAAVVVLGVIVLSRLGGHDHPTRPVSTPTATGPTRPAPVTPTPSVPGRPPATQAPAVIVQPARTGSRPAARTSRPTTPTRTVTRPAPPRVTVTRTTPAPASSSTGLLDGLLCDGLHLPLCPTETP